LTGTNLREEQLAMKVIEDQSNFSPRGVNGQKVARYVGRTRVRILPSPWYERIRNDPLEFRDKYILWNRSGTPNEPALARAFDGQYWNRSCELFEALAECFSTAPFLSVRLIADPYLKGITDGLRLRVEFCIMASDLFTATVISCDSLRSNFLHSYVTFRDRIHGHSELII
jgi:hypothetical protein